MAETLKAPRNFSDARLAVAEVQRLRNIYFGTVDQGIARITEGRNALDQMDEAAPAGWLGAKQYIDQQAAANPTDSAWQRLQAEMNKAVADFQADLTLATGIHTAATTARG